MEYATEVVSSPPSRNPANQGGRNILVDFASVKMGQTVSVESVSLEAAHAQMMETGPRYAGYWSQPRPVLILCTCRDGKKRRLWLTFDFLVIVDGRVELHECKPEAECIKLSAEFPGRYQKAENGLWHGPEIQAALREYGITFRIITESDVPATLVRNHALLAEVSGKEYSTPAAPANILTKLSRNAEGLPLKTLLGGVGVGSFSKNDVYLAIAKLDVFALLADSLLVDEKTTRVFAQPHHAEAYRLIHFSEAERQKGPTLALQVNDSVKWNGSDYTICNLDRNVVWLRSKNCDPVKFPKELLFRMIGSGEIVVPEKILFDREQRAKETAERLRQVTAGDHSLAVAKQQFLDFQALHPDAKPEHFGLKPITSRTLQRWKRAARHACSQFGMSLVGLIDKPRPGRPREVFEKATRTLATKVAEELYFCPERRSVNYCWRELKRRSAANNQPAMSKGAFRRHLRMMRNLKEATKDRNGARAAYKYGCAPDAGTNWITAGDFPFKLAQMDGKLNDVLLVDDETGEPLGRPSLSLIILPHYGIPIGMSLMLEPPSYRSATMALRDGLRRFGELPRFLCVDNGKEFNNATFDKLLAMLRITKVNRPPDNPRFSSEIESLFHTLDKEFVHNLAGNTQPVREVREMTAETNPETRAVWTFSAFHDALEKYLFEMLWDAPSAALGTTPRKAFERDRDRAPQTDQFVLPPEVTDLAFLPEVKRETRLVVAGRGVFVEGYYYWSDALAKPGIERTTVRVRYDPYDLYHVYVIAQGEVIECVAKDAPELRNATERHRHLACLARRRLKNNHAEVREETHGKKLAEFGEDNRAKEKQLREERRARAQKHAIDQIRPPKPRKPASQKTVMPKVSFSHLRKAA